MMKHVYNSLDKKDDGEERDKKGVGN